MNFSNLITQKQDKDFKISKVNTECKIENTNEKSAADFNDCFKILNPYLVSSDEKFDNSIEIKKNKGFFYDFISGKKVLNLNECAIAAAESNKDNNFSQIIKKSNCDNFSNYSRIR